MIAISCEQEARRQCQAWYLHAAGQGNAEEGGGYLSPQPPGPQAQDRLACGWQRGGDVGLRYTSPVLPEALEVAGPIRAVLHAVCDGLDGDWTVRLVDVGLDGRGALLCSGKLRARLWNSFAAPRPAAVYPVYEYTVDVGATGHVFGKGHRIGLEISLSPGSDRPGANGSLEAGKSVRPFGQRLFCDGERPSRVLLPVRAVY